MWPPPAPRSAASARGRLTASAPKLVSSRRWAACWRKSAPGSARCARSAGRSSRARPRSARGSRGGAEDEVGVAVEVEHGRQVGRGDEPGGLAAGTVEVLVVGVERDREDRAGAPLERHLGAGVVPHAGGPVAGQRQHHLLEELPLGRERPARRDLADVAVVGGAGGLVVDVHPVPAAALPRPQLHGAQVGDVVRGDDVEPLAGDPPGVGGVLLGRELGGERVVDEGGSGPVARRGGGHR